MKTETKNKGVEEILGEVKARAKAGGCKKCQYCIESPTDHYGTTHFCAIQGNVNPIEFSAACLDKEAYPYGPCDEGNWNEIGDDEKAIQLPGCLAYRPKGVKGVGERDTTIAKQWAFMQLLSDAARLHYAVEDVKKGKLDELLHKLNTWED